MRFICSHLTGFKRIHISGAIKPAQGFDGVSLIPNLTSFSARGNPSRIRVVDKSGASYLDVGYTLVGSVSAALCIKVSELK